MSVVGVPGGAPQSPVLIRRRQLFQPRPLGGQVLPAVVEHPGNGAEGGPAGELPQLVLIRRAVLRLQDAEYPEGLQVAGELLRLPGRGEVVLRRGAEPG